MSRKKHHKHDHCARLHYVHLLDSRSQFKDGYFYAEKGFRKYKKLK